MTEDWRALNQANWDERVAVHLAPGSDYETDALRRGTKRLGPIVSGVLGAVDGQKIAHLQCHFGLDSLALAQQGAEIVGLDFSGSAIAAATSLAAELGLPSRFVQSDIYQATTALDADLGTFDRVFVSWGALNWLPDMAAWARVVAGLLRPGGWLALAEAHPAAYVFDDEAASPDGMPGWYAPYFGRAPILADNTLDYANPTIPLTNSRTCEWLHPLSDVIGGLLAGGLRIDAFHEHDSVAWRMFGPLVEGADGQWRWPDRKWLPLSYSLRATKPLSST
jgi:SAM-dependent methyltransferase